MLDTLSARLKYQYLKRDSTPNFSNDPLPNGGANNPNYLLPYTSAFDLQSNTTNLWKLYLDWTPMMNTGVSFEGTWSKIDYDDVTYGRTSNDRQGYFLSGFWNLSDAWKLNAFGSWEETKYPSNHRYIGTVAGGPTPPPGYCTAANPNCYNPFAPANPNNSYNWSSGTKDTTWMIGVGADWQAMEALKLTGSYLYVSNEGNATFGVQDNITLAITPLTIGNFDNSKQQYFNLKGVWSYDKNWSFSGGYSYMKYSHDDVATSGYQYALPSVTNSGAGGVVPNNPASTSLSYGNGYDAYTDGHSNIFYLMVTYRFNALPLPVAPMRVAEAPKPVVAPPPPPPPAPPPPPPPPPPPKVTTLSADELFAFDSAVLTDKAKSALDNIAQDLNRDPKAPAVPIVGHTDRLGSDAYNLKLSHARADAVKSYLASKGVAAGRLQATGKGETEPVVQCTDKGHDALVKCLAPNRRVVIGPVTVPAN
jgi:outer membrane protein OmpA-like peptidoglycan-associated protein